jgi:hypothetical protein
MFDLHVHPSGRSVKECAPCYVYLELKVHYIADTGTRV